MKTKIKLYARVAQDGKFPFVRVQIKAGKPVAIPGASYYLRLNENGKRGWRALGSNLDDAYLAWANHNLARESEALGVAIPIGLKSDRKQLRAEAEVWIDELDSLGRAHKTVEAYELAINAFTAYCTKHFIDEITESDIIRYIGHLRTTLGKHKICGSKHGERNTTIANRLRNLRVFWKRCGMVFPLPERRWPKPTEKAPDRYSMDDFRKMRESATEDEKDLIDFFMFTGFRDGEVTHACYQDIEGRTINVHDKPQYGFKLKDHEERPISIPLPKEFVKRIAARMARHKAAPSALIFPASHGGPNRHLLDDVQDLAKRTKLSSWPTLHKFRRTFATLMHTRGFSLRQIQAMLGHSDLETTQAYLVADEATTPQALQIVDRGYAEACD